MSTTSMKFNPAFLHEGELVTGFVARIQELRRLLEIIRDNSGAANQHALILAPRGYGKTTLILRLAAEVRADPGLCRDWYPIVFSEEVEIATPGEFWAEALFFLAKQTNDENLSDTYKRLRRERNEARLRELALVELRAFALRENKRLLIAVENLQVIFTELLSLDDAWTVRYTLQNEPSIMLVTTSTVRFQTIEDPNQAFYELFHVIELDPLDADECARLFSLLSTEEIDPLRGRALQILTGGNPRLLVVLSRFTTGASLSSLVDDFARLLDDNSDYFKGNIDSLEPYERRIFTALAEIWTPAGAKEVAEFTRMDVSQVHKVLARLARRGLVVAQANASCDKRYQVSERLYNIYWILRRHGRASDRVRFVVDFIAAYYDIESLTQTCLEFANEALVRGHRERAVYIHSFYQLVARLPADNRAKVLLSLSQEFFALPESPKVELRQLSEEREKLQTSSSSNAYADPAALVQKIREFVDQQPCLRELEAIACSDSEVSRQAKTIIALFSAGAGEGAYDEPMREFMTALVRHFDDSCKRLAQFVKTAHRGYDLTLPEVIVVGALAVILDDDITPIRLTRLLLRRFPRSPWAQLVRVALRYALGYDDDDRSRLKALKICQKHPGRIDIHLALGLLFESHDERETARLFIQRAISPDMVLRLTDAILGIRDDILANEYELLLDPRCRPMASILTDEFWSDAVIIFYKFSSAFFDDKRVNRAILVRGAAALPNSFEIHVRLALAAVATRDGESEMLALTRARELPSEAPALQLALGFQLAFRQRNAAAREAILRSWRAYNAGLTDESMGLHQRVHEWLGDAACSVPELPHLAMLEQVSAPERGGAVDTLLAKVRGGTEYRPFDYVLIACICIVAGKELSLVDALRRSPSAPRVEPVLLALARYDGNDTLAPREVSEIANDIVRTLQLVSSVAAEVRGPPPSVLPGSPG